MTTTPRFSPPCPPPPAELEWILTRALAPPENPCPGRVDGERIIELTDRMLLGSLIARRTRAEVLEREIGRPAASRLVQQQRNDAAVQMQYRATCRLITELAAKLGQPVIFLKGMALQLAGVVAAGDRPVADVDVVLRENAAGELQRQLIEHGFKHGSAVSMRHPHHLPPLWSDRWLGVEVHTAVPGLQLAPGRRFATAEGLITAGLCRPVPELGSRALVPAPEVTAAHLVVHALVHHPEAEQFFFRLLADLLAVMHTAGREAVMGAGALIRWLVPENELSALLDLVTALEDGRQAVELVQGDGQGARLLGHFAALTVDPDYRRRVARPRLLLRDDPLELDDRSKLPRLWWPRRDVLGPDGRPLSRWQYLRWSIGRPLGLMGRIAGFVAKR